MLSQGRDHKKNHSQDENRLVNKLVEEIKQQITRTSESLSPEDFAASTQGIFFDEYDMY